GTSGRRVLSSAVVRDRPWDRAWTMRTRMGCSRSSRTFMAGRSDAGAAFSMLISFSGMRIADEEAAMVDTRSTGPTAPIGRRYLVDGRELLADVTGDGAPAVVFLAGAGAVGLDYWNVHDTARRLTTSVLYDRAGTGWSERIDLPRSSTEVTDELR